jgi:ABC-type glycerol-3-phosphate transport system permease component
MTTETETRIENGERQMARLPSPKTSPRDLQSSILHPHVPRRPRASRCVRYFAEHATLHLFLLAGVAIFLLPFLWMVFTSLKTDEELLEPGFLPAIPSFVGHSPYVRRTPALNKPLDVEDETWDKSLPRLQKLSRNAIADELKRHPIPGVDPQKVIDAAAPILINQLAPRIGAEVWKSKDTTRLASVFAPMLTGDAVAKAVDDRLARLELRNLQVRTIDGHVIQLLDGDAIGKSWKVLSGPGELISTVRAGITQPEDATILRYHFDSASSAPIVLQYDFNLPCAPADLHKLLLSMKDDDSWHRISATLDFGSGHWVTTRTSWIAQNRPGSIIFQPPSYDDQTFRNKIWIPLKRVGPSAIKKVDHGAGADKDLDSGSSIMEGAGDQQPIIHHPPPAIDASPASPARLTLTIRPSSTLAAIYGKTIRNYERTFYQVPFLRYIFNSVVLVVLMTIGTLLSSTFVAYAFARLHWPGKTVAFAVLLSTMMLPAQATFIPQFLIWRQLGWYNTLNPIWVPAWLGGAFFIFLMTQYMRTIPRELEEAARIDGLNSVQTWWYVIVPLVKPAAAAIAILTVMGAWNEFLGPLIYLRDQSKFPLSLGLFGLRVDVANDWTLLMAGNVMMTLPVLIMFFLFQRYFIEGMTMTGMKS